VANKDIKIAEAVRIAGVYMMAMSRPIYTPSIPS